MLPACYFISSGRDLQVPLLAPQHKATTSSPCSCRTPAMGGPTSDLASWLQLALFLVQEHPLMLQPDLPVLRPEGDLQLFTGTPSCWTWCPLQVCIPLLTQGDEHCLYCELLGTMLCFSITGAFDACG